MLIRVVLYSDSLSSDQCSKSLSLNDSSIGSLVKASITVLKLIKESKMRGMMNNMT